jgi:hypothetical protein
MKENKNLLPAIILAAGLIIAASIYAYSTRYEFIEKTSGSLGLILVDKWKLEIVIIANKPRIFKDK